ncbi:hypothetical protein AB751O23_AA_00640 [Chlamydiales bacterium SCGC AB-751-O23]|nr:hypothetical protein AB751O23_AA_00640 [Chlamydiales bacterium SCGC AB-751-O23]
MLLKKLTSYLQNYLKSGISLTYSKEIKRKIYLTDLMATSISAIAFLNIPFFYFALDSLALALMSVLAILYAFVPQTLNKMGYHRLAISGFLAIFNLSVFIFSIFLPEEIRAQLIFFPISLLPFVLFEFSSWVSKIVWTSISAILLSSVYLLAPWVEPRYIFTETVTQYFFYSILFTALGINFMIVFYKSILYHQAELKSDLALSERAIFLANMSHEIRTPMNGILGMASLLEQEESLSEDQVLRVKTIVKSGKSLVKIVDNILDYSKLEFSKLNLNPEPVSLINVIEEVISLFTPSAQMKKNKIKLTLPRKKESYLLIDAMKVKQVLQNLISNAVKFTKEGLISISAKIEHHNGLQVLVVISVKDTGEGISNSFKPYLFQPFSQAPSRSGRCNQGSSGLGLLISKEIVKLMGGNIVCKSKEGKGSCFTVSFFAEKTDEFNLILNKKVDIDRIQSFSASKNPLRILVVEDDEINRVVVKGFLNNLGYKPTIVSGGGAAIKLLKKEIYDLAFVDCHMPYMDGFELARYIKHKLPKEKRPRVVALTASAMKEDKEKCIKCSMQGFISKPFLKENLVKELCLTSKIVQR